MVGVDINIPFDSIVGIAGGTGQSDAGATIGSVSVLDMADVIAAIGQWCRCCRGCYCLNRLFTFTVEFPAVTGSTCFKILETTLIPISSRVIPVSKDLIIPPFSYWNGRRSEYTIVSAPYSVLNRTWAYAIK
jgi:hypothetical protein